MNPTSSGDILLSTKCKKSSVRCQVPSSLSKRGCLKAPVVSHNTSKKKKGRQAGVIPLSQRNLPIPVTTHTPLTYCYSIHCLEIEAVRCKATEGEESEEPALLCSTGRVPPEICVGTMLSKLGRERARPWRRRACCMPFPFSYQAAKTAASVPGGMQSSFKEGQFRVRVRQFSIPLPPVKPNDQEQER